MLSLWFLSLSRGMLILPKPPSRRLALVQASRLYSLSVLAKTTEAPREAKSAARSLKAMISVGQTKVQAMGTKPRTSHCLVEVYWVRLRSGAARGQLELVMVMVVVVVGWTLVGGDCRRPLELEGAELVRGRTFECSVHDGRAREGRRGLLDPDLGLVCGEGHGAGGANWRIGGGDLESRGRLQS